MINVSLHDEPDLPGQLSLDSHLSPDDPASAICSVDIADPALAVAYFWWICRCGRCFAARREASMGKTQATDDEEESQHHCER